MLKLGENSISKLYYGDTSISKAYFGDNLVYSPNVLPDYDILPYLEADGSHYIVTDFVPTNETGVYFKGTLENDKDQIVVGSRNTTNNDSRLFPIATVVYCAGLGRGKYYRISTANRLTANKTYEQWYNFYNDKMAKAKQDGIGTISTTLSDIEFVPTYPLFVFCGNIQGTPTYFFSGTLEKLQFTEGTELIRNFIPVSRKLDGVKGLYDMLTGKFHRLRHKDGTIKNEYVTSLDTTGGCWFDVPYKANQDTEFRVIFTHTNTSANRYVLSDVTYNRLLVPNGSNTFGKRSFSCKTTANEKTNIILNKNGVTYNGTTTAFSSVSDFTSKTNLTLWAYSTGGSSPFEGSFEMLQILEAGELVLDWKPFTDEEGVPCFRDTVSGTNNYPLGTGTLTYTE